MTPANVGVKGNQPVPWGNGICVLLDSFSSHILGFNIKGYPELEKKILRREESNLQFKKLPVT
jgi:hypothetical protein